MKIRPKNIQKFVGGGTPQNGSPGQSFMVRGNALPWENSYSNIPIIAGSNVFFNETLPAMTPNPTYTPLTGINNSNNIRYKDDFKTYNQWHADNVIKNWHDRISKEKDRAFLETYNFEGEITNALDSWNKAGGFQWLNATDDQRSQRMISENGEVAKHQELINRQFPILNRIIGEQKQSYIYPSNPNTNDRYIENNDGLPKGTDNDFGVQTGNRRPTIHVNTSDDTFKWWSNFYRDLGYKGAYEYLNHWVPTKDPTKVQRSFADEVQKPITAEGQTPAVDDQREVVEVNGGTKPVGTGGSDVPQGKKDPGINWKEVFKNVGEGLQKQLPNILEDVRLAGNLIANDRIYNEALKGIRPNLHQTYNTYRQVVGDEATKQAYYKRAAAGQTAANITRTSDMDKQMAYSMEARAQADKLRAEGDLADNQRIRETSELSSQHADANRQRATQIANENIDQINAANQAKHNLLSQKHAANQTSWDNFLKGRISSYRQRIAEEKAIDDQIQVLVRSGMIEDDDKLKDLQTELEAASKKPENQKNYGGYIAVDHSKPEIKDIDRRIKERQRQLAIKSLIMQKQGIPIAKSGTKITRNQYLILLKNYNKVELPLLQFILQQ